MSSGFSDTGRFPKLPYMGIKSDHQEDFPKLHRYYLNFYPRLSKLSFFLLYEQQFQRYRPIFKICHVWGWNLATGKIPRSCTYKCSFFLSQGVEIELVFTLWAAVSEIWAAIQIAIFVDETLPLAKVPTDKNWWHERLSHANCLSWTDTGQIRIADRGLWSIVPSWMDSLGGQVECFVPRHPMISFVPLSFQTCPEISSQWSSPYYIDYFLNLSFRFLISF